MHLCTLPNQHHNDIMVYYTSNLELTTSITAVLHEPDRGRQCISAQYGVQQGATSLQVSRFTTFPTLPNNDKPETVQGLVRPSSQVTRNKTPPVSDRQLHVYKCGCRLSTHPRRLHNQRRHDRSTTKHSAHFRIRVVHRSSQLNVHVLAAYLPTSRI